jgi:hypothetical protein
MGHMKKFNLCNFSEDEIYAAIYGPNLCSSFKHNAEHLFCVYIYSNIQVSKLGIFLVYTWGNERQDFLWTTNECTSDHCLNFTANHYYTDSGFNCTTLPGIT